MSYGKCLSRHVELEVVVPRDDVEFHKIWETVGIQSEQLLKSSFKIWYYSETGTTRPSQVPVLIFTPRGKLASQLCFATFAVC